MKYTFDDIKDLIIREIGSEASEVSENCQINSDLGCHGDDFHEFIAEYSLKFNVDMQSYLWYFHTEEEGSGMSIGGSFFKPPYERVKHIPVTPAQLLEFANKGKWDMSYPEHNIPRKRYDILINQIFLIVFIAFMFYKCTR